MSPCRVARHTLQVKPPFEAVLEDIQTTKSYGMFKAYSRSKLYNIAFAFELQRRVRQSPNSSSRLKGLEPTASSASSSIIVNAVHPGNVLTNVMRDMHPCIVWMCVSMPYLCHLYAVSLCYASGCHAWPEFCFLGHLSGNGPPGRPRASTTHSTAQVWGH